MQLKERIIWIITTLLLVDSITLIGVTTQNSIHQLHHNINTLESKISDDFLQEDDYYRDIEILYNRLERIIDSVPELSEIGVQELFK